MAAKFNLACGGCGTCAVCQRIRVDPMVAEAFGVPFDPARAVLHGAVPSRHLLPCRKRGGEVGRTKCPSCSGHVEVKTFACEQHVVCQAIPKLPGIRDCATCSDYTLAPAPVRHARIGGLVEGRSFNGGAIRYRDRVVIAYRKEWVGSKLYVADFDPATWQAENNFRLDLGPLAQEDPRLFIFRDRLHISYTSYDGKVTDLHYARLTEDGRQVERIFRPTLPSRQSWEKNWGLFECDGSLYAVYRIAPLHRVLKIDEEQASELSCISWIPSGGWGDLRGGAAPVRHDDEFWSFAHSYRGGSPDHYVCSLYTFEAAPPFRPKRWLPEPLILSPGQGKPSARVPEVVYPQGAYYDEGVWRVTGGVYDHWIEGWEFRHTDLSASMIAAPEVRG